MQAYIEVQTSLTILDLKIYQDWWLLWFVSNWWRIQFKLYIVLSCFFFLIFFFTYFVNDTIITKKNIFRNFFFPFLTWHESCRVFPYFFLIIILCETASPFFFFLSTCEKIIHICVWTSVVMLLFVIGLSWFHFVWRVNNICVHLLRCLSF